MSRRFRIFLAVLAVLVLYTGLQAGRLFPGAPPAAVWAGTIAFFWAMLGWQFLYRSRASVLESRWFTWLAWGGSIALGVWASFILISIPLDLLGAIARLAGRGRPYSAGEAALALSAAGLIAALGLRQALLGPEVRRLKVPIKGLPAGLEGLRIAHISDLHIGPTIRDGYVESVVEKVLALEPDLIAVTGDLADGTVSSLERHVRPLSRLRAPLGVFFVTGNHEYYWGAAEWLREAARLGFKTLVDENVLVKRGGGVILVGGVPDSSAPFFLPAHRSDPKMAAKTSGTPGLRLLLAHRPDACFEAEKAGFDLQLSGHTHGGQFFPFNLVVRLFHPYHRGLDRHGRMWVHVNPGTGYWGPPLRLWVPSEISLLTLVSAAT